jgi:2-dehydropantoate 2-reductase
MSVPASRGRPLVRILVMGAGVIGSIYAAKLIDAGHHVVLVARGDRLTDLTANGLVLVDGESGLRTVLAATTVAAPDPALHYDLALVPVRAEQLAGTLQVLSEMRDGPDVLFLGNIASQRDILLATLGPRALFGFPAAGGVRAGSAIRYALINQQKTMLGEPSGATTDRVRRLRTMLTDAGFPTTISSDMSGWLEAHAAFVVPIAFALYRTEGDPAKLAADRQVLRLMVTATRQCFAALRSGGNREIPANLKALYRLPSVVIVQYWRRVFAGPRGELWFAGHTRAAPEEMHALAAELVSAVARTGRPVPDLQRLLDRPT